MKCLTFGVTSEDTEDHREIFSEEGKAVVYFNNIGRVIEKARWLRESDDERQRLARSSHEIITSGKHTYRDRLASMLFPANCVA